MLNMLNMMIKEFATFCDSPCQGKAANAPATKVLHVTQLPNPEWLEISEEDGAFFLYYLNADLECFADTWHQTLESAQREALLGFGIKSDEWTEVEPS